MKRFTVSVPKTFKEKLDTHPEVNWSEIMKQGILKKLEELRNNSGKY
jgi:hypothetical protein